MRSQRPSLWVIAGPNGSGKTTLTRRWVAGRMPIVNPDELTKGLPRIQGHLDERGGGEAAIRERRQRLAARDTFAIETTLSGKGLMQFMRKARDADYKVRLVFVCLRDPALSISRVADRVAAGGHDVPIDAIIRRYDDGTSQLEAAMEIAERSYVVDNTGEKRRLVLVRDNGKDRFVGRNPPEWARQALSSVAWDEGNGGVPPELLGRHLPGQSG